jgi:hypothetical protein
MQTDGLFLLHDDDDDDDDNDDDANQWYLGGQVQCVDWWFQSLLLLVSLIPRGVVLVG